MRDKDRSGQVRAEPLAGLYDEGLVSLIYFQFGDVIPEKGRVRPRVFERGVKTSVSRDSFRKHARIRVPHLQEEETYFLSISARNLHPGPGPGEGGCTAQSREIRHTPPSLRQRNAKQEEREIVVDYN